MILNIAFTHPEKIYKGNKTVTNSEGNVVRLSRQKWMSVCSWRNALQGCSWRAWLGPALCRGLLSCTLTPSSSFSKFSEPILPTRQRLEKKPEASNCYCVYVNLFLPQFCDLSVMGEPFTTAKETNCLEAPRRGWWKDLKLSYQKYQLLSAVIVPLIVTYSCIFCSLSHEN